MDNGPHKKVLVRLGKRALCVVVRACVCVYNLSVRFCVSVYVCARQVMCDRNNKLCDREYT